MIHELNVNLGPVSFVENKELWTNNSPKGFTVGQQRHCHISDWACVCTSGVHFLGLIRVRGFFFLFKAGKGLCEMEQTH